LIVVAGGREGAHHVGGACAADAAGEEGDSDRYGDDDDSDDRYLHGPLERPRKCVPGHDMTPHIGDRVEVHRDGRRDDRYRGAEAEPPERRPIRPREPCHERACGQKRRRFGERREYQRKPSDRSELAPSIEEDNGHRRQHQRDEVRL
jgi:hypothetical protein